MTHPGLIETLRDAQRFGFFGPGSVTDAYDHALGFVTAVGAPVERLCDLGSGGGLPGLVLADAFRECEIVLLDRRAKRTDFLRRAVLRLGFDHVEVRTIDADVLVSEVASGADPGFDVVTARGFGPPATTLSIAVGVCRPGGRVVVSEPPDGDRWDRGFLRELGVTDERLGGVRVFHLV